MDIDPIELAMKAATMAGVVVAAAGIVMVRVPPEARTRCFALAAAGVALMFANALVAASPFAVLIDAAYLAVAAATLLGGVREARAGPAPLLSPAQALEATLQPTPAPVAARPAAVVRPLQRRP